MLRSKAIRYLLDEFKHNGGGRKEEKSEKKIRKSPKKKKNYNYNKINRGKKSFYLAWEIFSFYRNKQILNFLGRNFQPTM